METVKVESIPRTFEALVAACRSFVEIHKALAKADADTRAVVDELVAAIDSEAMDVTELESVFAAIAQVMIPYLEDSLEPATQANPWDTLSDEEKRVAQEMDMEEETFARRLAAEMEVKGVTQTELALRVGVRQSAISMMLSRSCRPQRRTVEKIAQALNVEIGSLWPAYGVTGRESLPEKALMRGREPMTWSYSELDLSLTPGLHARLPKSLVPDSVFDVDDLIPRAVKDAA